MAAIRGPKTLPTYPGMGVYLVRALGERKKTNLRSSTPKFTPVGNTEWSLNIRTNHRQLKYLGIPQKQTQTRSGGVCLHMSELTGHMPVCTHTRTRACTHTRTRTWKRCAPVGNWYAARKDQQTQRRKDECPWELEITTQCEKRPWGKTVDTMRYIDIQVEEGPWMLSRKQTWCMLEVFALSAQVFINWVFLK